MTKPQDFDLLIIDIDDTFIYHRTVAFANRIFLENLFSLFKRKPKNDFYTTKKSLFKIIHLLLFNWYRFSPNRKRIRNLVILTSTAIKLHFLNLARKLINIFRYQSNENIIKIWAETVIRIGILPHEYSIPKKVMLKDINKKMLRLLKSLRINNPKMTVLGISEHFTLEKDPIKDILGISEYHSNMFKVDNGIISGYRIYVKDSEDKKRIAEKVIERLLPEKIGLIIEDFDDIGLLSLDNLSVVIHSKRLRRFVRGIDARLIEF